jgi:DNA-directed RNA polymerase specialized sigma24 family protein
MSIIGRLWSAEEDAFLTANYLTMDPVEIARKLDRTYKSVQVRASLKGLARRRKRYSRRLWDKDESRFVLENYGPMSASQVAAHLGRTEDAVRKWIVRYENNRSIA